MTTVQVRRFFVNDAYTYRYAGRGDLVWVLKGLGLGVGPFQYHVVSRKTFHNRHTDDGARMREVVAFIDGDRLIIQPQATDPYRELMKHPDFIVVSDWMTPLHSSP